MKRIRSNLSQSVLHNDWNDTEVTFQASEIHHDLTNDGGIQSHEICHMVALSCGHFAQPVGLCGVCERPVCAACNLMCDSCARPIGRCHAVGGDDGKWRCVDCAAARNRALLARKLLSPFVRFKGESS
jgi:hypothetical protein